MSRLFPLLATLALASLPTMTRADLPPLIPREVLFGNPEKVSPQISPDGKKLAWIAPDKAGVLQVWVKTIGEDDDKSVTLDKKRGIRQYGWAQTSKDLFYLQDTDGDENWHVYRVDLTSAAISDITPHKGVQARLHDTDRDHPDEILIFLNLRNPQQHDVYRYHLSTGKLDLDTENPGGVSSFMTDPQYKVRGSQSVLPDGGTEIRIRDDEKSAWKPWIKVGPEEILAFIDFTVDGKAAILRSSVGSDKARVIVKGIASGEERLIAASERVDAGAVFIHPTRHQVQAVSFAPGRATWTVVDPEVNADFLGIARLSPGDFSILNRDTRDATWLVAFTSARGPIRYYSWDRKSKKGTFLFVHQPKLEGLDLAAMIPVTIPARDGLQLAGYLTLPVGLPEHDLPLVLLVHGGPWSRDTWGYNPSAQWFANRGYACLMVNFRGSTGYGKSYLNAGNRQWGLKMHDDLIDSVDWVVARGVVDKKRVAIYGGSYGGYAALAGVTMTPEAFTCAVDIVGPSNLKTLIGSVPPYWKPMRAMFDVRMGNVDDSKDADLIRAASPLFKADKIVRPLLIGQGQNDPRVNVGESEQIVSAIAKNGGKVTYVLYPDEGHGFRRPANSIDFNARAEAFLAKHLGGRFEPLEGDKYPGSTAIVREVGK